MPEERRKRGSGRKLPPPGYYTAKEAMELLGLNKPTFYTYVNMGKIQKHVPPLRKEGFYKREEIHRLAAEIALFLLEKESPIETRVAIPADAQGIYNVLVEGFGWPSARPEQRIAWYKVNAMIDYVVLYEGIIYGYVTSVPYTPDALDNIMAGRKRAWHMKPDDILPYTVGRRYNLYVGAAVRKDSPDPKALARRLLSGFITFLQELAESGIIIEKLYAVSAEEDGRQLCRKLGFVQQETQPGDLFQDARFVLDLQTSDSRFARLYRKSIKQEGQ